MIIERADMGDATVIRVDGDIDERGVNDLRLALLDCIRECRRCVVVNLSDVRFISYMGVGVLVERLRQLRASGGDMKLVGVNLYTQRLFRMVGVTTVFDVFESETEALEVLREAA